MKNLVACAALLLLAANASEAKVLIYKGSIRAASDTESAPPRLKQTFFIFDPDLNLIGSVSTIVADGKKLIQVSPPAEFRFSQAPLPLGKTATVASFAQTSGGSNDSYNNFMIHARGTNASLPFNSGVTGNLTTFPRAFRGIILQDSAFESKGSFLEGRFNLSYQQTRSIAANDANQTAEQAITAIVEQLKLQGFVLP